MTSTRLGLLKSAPNLSPRELEARRRLLSLRTQQPSTPTPISASQITLPHKPREISSSEAHNHLWKKFRSKCDRLVSFITQSYNASVAQAYSAFCFLSGGAAASRRRIWCALRLGASRNGTSTTAWSVRPSCSSASRYRRSRRRSASSAPISTASSRPRSARSRATFSPSGSDSRGVLAGTAPPTFSPAARARPPPPHDTRFSPAFRARLFYSLLKL